MIMLAGCTSDATESSTTTPAATTLSQPTTSSVDESARLAAQQSAAESSRLAQEEAARLAAEQAAARLAAQEAARVEAERVAAEQAAAEQAAAEQAAAEEAARQAAEEQAQFGAAVDAGSCTEAPADRVGECIGLVDDRGAEAAAENGWYDSRGWVSPETAKRALAAGLPPGGDVPGYLRCGTICGEEPTSGEVQSWNEGLEPVPPGYESWLAPNATPYTGGE